MNKKYFAFCVGHQKRKSLTKGNSLFLYINYYAIIKSKISSPGAHEREYMTPSLPGEVYTAVKVFISHTFIVPSNDAVARRSGLSGLNLQSKMVSTCP